MAGSGGGFMGLGMMNALGTMWSGFAAADQVKKKNDEEIRRQLEQGKQQIGRAAAVGAASGVEFNSASLQAYLGNMSEQFAKHAMWQKEASNATQADILFSAGASSITDFAKAAHTDAQANNWWQEPKGPR